MSLLPLFHWLAHTHVGTSMRDLTWAFAIVEIVHLIALAVFGGAILFLDLRLMGIGFTSQSAPQVAREFLPTTVIGAIVMTVTGALLLASGPMRYYYNTPFRIKMWLFLVAVFVHFVLQVKVARADPEHDGPSLARTTASAFSLFLWASIGIAGRAIGYF
jgi:putative copper export protein